MADWSLLNADLTSERKEITERNTCILYRLIRRSVPRGCGDQSLNRLFSDDLEYKATLVI